LEKQIDQIFGLDPAGAAREDIVPAKKVRINSTCSFRSIAPVLSSRTTKSSMTKQTIRPEPISPRLQLDVDEGSRPDNEIQSSQFPQTAPIDEG
jgi:hypothetical protein